VKEDKERVPIIRRTGWVAGGTALMVVAVMVLSATGAAAAVPRPLVATSPLASCSVDNGSQYPAYDPVNHYVYVPDELSGKVTVLSGKCTVKATISLPSGASPIAAAFFPANNGIYVTDGALNQVYEIQGTKVVGTMTDSSFQSPWAILYDPAADVLVVTNSASGTVSWMNAYGVFGFQGVGADPLSIGYNPYWQLLYVANYLSDNLTAIDAFNLTNIGSVAVGSGPTGVAYDPTDECVYVSNSGSDNVSVVWGPLVFHTIKHFQYPDGVAWDQSALAIYVTNYNTGNVSIIKGYKVIATEKAGKDASRLVYDEYDNYVYVTSWTAKKVYVVA
jgi:YVTN family beta-propeller protein